MDDRKKVIAIIVPTFRGVDAFDELAALIPARQLSD